MTSTPARSWSRMVSWVASSNVSLTSVWPYSPALILSSAVQNQPGKPWLPITCVGIGGSAALTRCSLPEGPALGNGGAPARRPSAPGRESGTRTTFCGCAGGRELREFNAERRSAARAMIGLTAMQIRFWGTRGSIAAPGPKTARYGGNTSCVEGRGSHGAGIILDCGTGARELRLHLARTMPPPLPLPLFICPTPSDHIQGVPLFVPPFLP